MVNSAAWRIEVEKDLKSFLTRLNAFDKDVAKILKRDMKRGANNVTKEARSIIRGSKNPPLSNWGKSWQEADRSSQDSRNLRWDTATVMKGIKTRPNTTTRDRAVKAFGFDVVQESAVGSIFELAGLSNKGYRGTRSGGSMKMRENIRRRAGRGPSPRSLFPAYYAAMPQVQREIEAAIAAAAKAVGK